MFLPEFMKHRRLNKSVYHGVCIRHFAALAVSLLFLITFFDICLGRSAPAAQDNVYRCWRRYAHFDRRQDGRQMATNSSRKQP